MKKIILYGFAVAMLVIGCSLDNIEGRSNNNSSENSDGYINFRVEPTRKATFVTIIPLKRGTEIYLIIRKLNPNESFRMHLCGTPCNTATTIATWGEIYENEGIIISVPETGKYYFWIEDITSESSESVVYIDSSEPEGDNLIVFFDSGSEIMISTVKPQPNVPSILASPCFEPKFVASCYFILFSRSTYGIPAVDLIARLLIVNLWDLSSLSSAE